MLEQAKTTVLGCSSHFATARGMDSGWVMGGKRINLIC
jgi:hypothetical protein